MDVNNFAVRGIDLEDGVISNKEEGLVYDDWVLIEVQWPVNLMLDCANRGESELTVVISIHEIVSLT